MRLAQPLARQLQSKLGRGVAVARAAAVSSSSSHGYAVLSSNHQPRQRPEIADGTSGSLQRKRYTTYSQLPSEHQMVYEMCRKFADEELAPNAGEWDREHKFPTEAVDKLVSEFRG